MCLSLSPSRKRRRGDSSEDSDAFIGNFLDLPPELRCMIYSYAMESDTGCVAFMWKNTNSYIGYYSRRSYRRERKSPVLECDLEHSIRTSEHIGPTRAKPTLNLSILATCKQIYRECRPYLWKNNAFLFNSPESLR